MILRESTAVKYSSHLQIWFWAIHTHNASVNEFLHFQKSLLFVCLFFFLVNIRKRENMRMQISSFQNKSMLKTVLFSEQRIKRRKEMIVLLICWCIALALEKNPLPSCFICSVGKCKAQNDRERRKKVLMRVLRRWCLFFCSARGMKYEFLVNYCNLFFFPTFTTKDHQAKVEKKKEFYERWRAPKRDALPVYHLHRDTTTLVPRHC